MKKHESQVVERDKLKLNAIVLHDNISKKMHMTQLVRFSTENLVTVSLA